MNPVATNTQRRHVLRQINRAELGMLPPGWDKGLEHQFGSALIEPAQNHTTTAANDVEQDPISLARPRTTHQPAPTLKHAPMPIPTTRRTRLVALARWMAAALVFTGLALTFVYHP